MSKREEDGRKEAQKTQEGEVQWIESPVAIALHFALIDRFPEALLCDSCSSLRPYFTPCSP